MLFTRDGRYVLDGVSIANDGTRVREGTMFLEDGTRLYHLIDHTIPTYALTSNLQGGAIQNERVSFIVNLECINNADRGNELKVSVIIPAGFTLVSAISNQGTFNTTTGLWTLYLDDQEADLNLILEAESTGSQTITVTLQSPYESTDFVCDVSASDTASIASYDADLADYPVTIANLQDGKTYTVISYSKVTEASIHDGIKNNRLSVVNGVETFGSRATVINTIEKQIVTFVYDETQPVLIRRYEQYESVDSTTENEWLGLCINEDFNTVYSASTNLLANPEALFDDTSASNITITGNSESAEYIYKVSEETTLATQFFTGLILSLNSFGQSSSQIQAQIATDDYDSEVKTGFMATGQTGEVAFGDMVDMWGLTDSRIQNKELSLHLIFKNTTLVEQVFSYNNITLLEYYADDETRGHHSIIYNDTHGKVLGISINDDTHPEGPSFDLETKKIALSDGELPVRFNIKSKELEFDFWVHGDTLEESETKLKAIRQWLANERTSMSRPILNRLTFTYDLNREYLVIFKDAITVKKEITSLLCTAKFVVPDGVAWSTIPVVTGAIGTNPGEAQVYPLLEVICDGSDTLTITDSVTGNNITLNNAPTTNTVLYFDCATQTVTDSTGTEYTTSLAKNTVWVNFQGKANYALTVSGGVLQQVKFYPGY